MSKVTIAVSNELLANLIAVMFEDGDFTELINDMISKQRVAIDPIEGFETTFSNRAGHANHFITVVYQ